MLLQTPAGESFAELSKLSAGPSDEMVTTVSSFKLFMQGSLAAQHHMVH